jgi:hypothetical protein
MNALNVTKRNPNRYPNSMIAVAFVVVMVVSASCGNVTITAQTALTTNVSDLVTMVTLNEDQQAAIYAAIIRQYYYMDYQKIGNKGYLTQPTIIYIDDHYGDSTGHPMENQDSGPIPEDMQARIANMLNDLPAPISWVKSGWSSVTLGKILSQSDGSVQISVVYLYGNVDVSGRIYTLEKVNGTWQVVGDWEVFWGGP